MGMGEFGPVLLRAGVGAALGQVTALVPSGRLASPPTWDGWRETTMRMAARGELASLEVSPSGGLGTGGSW